MTLKAVIFDYKALFRVSGPHVGDLQVVLKWLQDNGLKICVFSTERIDVSTMSWQAGYPQPDLYLCREDIPGSANRGAKAWTETVASRLGIQLHQLLYVGTTNLDWRSAINTGVFHVHALWQSPQPRQTTCINAPTPHAVAVHAGQFLMERPRWSFELDDPQRRFSLRSLLPARASLPSTAPSSTFTLQDVLTYKKTVKVGSDEGRNLLVFHALSSLYLEGLLPPGAIFCVYPSSTKGNVNFILQEFVKPAASTVHGFYRDDLIVRSVNAVDTSLARYRGEYSSVHIGTQASTVQINPDYAYKLKGKTVIVCDDFTTSGMSLEWARNLLIAAGVEKVILFTIGKYSNRHTLYDLAPGKMLDPFTVSTLGVADFIQSDGPIIQHTENEARLQGLFQRAIEDMP